MHIKAYTLRRSDSSIIRSACDNCSLCSLYCPLSIIAVNEFIIVAAGFLATPATARNLKGLDKKEKLLDIFGKASL